MCINLFFSSSQINDVYGFLFWKTGLSHTESQSRTRAVTQHLLEKAFKYIKISKKNKKIYINQKQSITNVCICLGQAISSWCP